MKKIILFSFFMMSFASLTSCTADAIEDTVANQTVSDDDSGGGTGGQTGVPKPPKP
ncbi:hypothetical protein [Flavobacterium solisilvae]|uniref:Entericidin n=1 Tax=Flavobacterium solisilvae TaxID=1852019 RepID=A0ABX1QTU0_9FLAO|nr:hypothetical protein [Flavobacterium solisilvae]NMH24342.1 hypothetical protein [Flavobacterium solisilvae]